MANGRNLTGKQKQELIKPIVRVGNSAGVILPREWLNGKVRVELVERPLNIKKDVLEILDDYLEDIIGVYIVGSYARGEQTKESDVDVLVITNKESRRIEIGKYELIFVKKEDVESELKKNVLPLLPMIKEAKVLMNSDLIEKWKKTELTKKNLKPHIELTKSALKVVDAALKVDDDVGEKNAGDAIAYSLVLHLRSLYIISCLKKRKKWSSGGLKDMIKKITKSLKAYEGYLRVKNKEKVREDLPIGEAEKLYKYIEREVKRQEKW